jgi:hypothetical protein
MKKLRPCFICGRNMGIASERRLVFRSHAADLPVTQCTAEVHVACYRQTVNAAAEGVETLCNSEPARVFATRDQAKNYARALALAPAEPDGYQL